FRYGAEPFIIRSQSRGSHDKEVTMGHSAGNGTPAPYHLTQRSLLMIVVMKSSSSEEQIEHVLTFLDHHGLTGHLSRGVERTVIGVLGRVGPSGVPGSIGGINPAL